MKRLSIIIVSTSCLALIGCAAGPRPIAGMPKIRSIPVLASMSASDSLEQGKSYLRMKQYGLAIEMLKSAARDEVQAAEAFNGLAIAYDAIGRQDLAERYFERAMAAAPGETKFEANLGRFYAASNQPEKQRKLLAAREAADAMPKVALNDSVIADPFGGEATATPALASAGDIQSMVVPASMNWVVNLSPDSPLGASIAPLNANSAMANFVPVELDGAKCWAGNDGAAAQPCLWMAKDDVAAAAKTDDKMMIRLSLGEVFLITGETQTNHGRAMAAAPKLAPAAAPATTVSHGFRNRDYLGMIAAALDLQNRAAAASSIQSATASQSATPAGYRTLHVSLIKHQGKSG